MKLRYLSVLVLMLISAAPGSAVYSEELPKENAVAVSSRPLLSEESFQKLRSSIAERGEDRTLSPKPMAALGLQGRQLTFKGLSVENSRGIHTILESISEPQIVIFAIKSGDEISYMRTRKDAGSDFLLVSGARWPKGAPPSAMTQEDSLLELRRELEIWSRAAESGEMDRIVAPPPVSGGGHDPSGRLPKRKGH